VGLGPAEIAADIVLDLIKNKQHHLFRQVLLRIELPAVQDELFELFGNALHCIEHGINNWIVGQIIDRRVERHEPRCAPSACDAGDAQIGRATRLLEATREGETAARTNHHRPKNALTYGHATNDSEHPYEIARTQAREQMLGKDSTDGEPHWSRGQAHHRREYGPSRRFRYRDEAAAFRGGGCLGQKP